MSNAKNLLKTLGSNKLILILAVIVVGLGWSIMFDVNIAPSEKFLAMVGKVKPEVAPPQEANYENLTAQVLPDEGYTVDIVWGDIGVKLVEAGGIDIEKYSENYSGSQWEELMTYLTENKNQGITITKENAYFWVNTLWALGLTQKSDVLDKGVMGTEYKERVGNFASTGGWTLGSRESVGLYSSTSIIPLTQAQHDMVAEVSSHIYRPCCGNPTSFPDCNHGMAILGLLQIMASQGATEEEMYEAALAFNSFWFTQTYIDLAYYFQTTEGVMWKDVDAKKALSAEFSSAQGYQAIKEQIGNIPGSKSAGASCGA